MSLMFVPLYIEFMGIESYGIIGILMSIQALFGLLDMGLSATLNRELARLSVLRENASKIRDMVRTLEIVYWAVACFIAFFIIGLSWPIAHYWVHSAKMPDETVRQALMIIGLVVAFRWPLTFYSSGLTGLQKQVLLNVIHISAATLRGVGAFLILWTISPTIQAFLIWQVLISILHTSTTAVFLWRNLPHNSHPSRFQKKVFLRIWRFAAGMTGITFSSIILTQIDKIVLSKILTLEMFGYYTLASVVANGLYYIIGPVFHALFPRFTQLVSLNDPKTLRTLYHKSCQLMSVLIVPITVVVSFFSSEILFVWTGDTRTIENTHSIVTILIIGVALDGLRRLPFGIQLAHAWTRLTFYANTLASIVLVPMTYLLVTNYGIVGAASARVIVNAAYLLLYVEVMHSHLFSGERCRYYLTDVALPLLPVIPTVLLWRVFFPNDMSRYAAFFYLSGVSVTALISSVIMTPYPRLWITSSFSKTKVTYRSA